MTKPNGRGDVVENSMAGADGPAGAAGRTRAPERGGTATMTRPAAAPGRLAGPPGVRRPRSAPRPGQRTRPHLPAPARGSSAPPRPGAAAGARPGAAQRMPFVFLLFGLLGGALVCALVISTTLAEGSFQITNLQQQNAVLARQRQELQEQVAQAQSAQTIEQQAHQLGMRSVGELRFLNLRTGKIETDAGTGVTAAISVPGYTP